MKNLIAATAIALTLGASAANVQAADLTAQPIATVKIDIQGVAQGYRASKLIGTTIYNDDVKGNAKRGDAIGKVNDLIVGQSDKVLYAIVDVGSFLGMGGKLVVIPYSVLQVVQDGKSQDLVVPGATKDMLKSMPKFEYAK
jgi:hypothetical protein